MHEDVFRLQIPMDYILSMHQLQALANLLDKMRCQYFTCPFLPLDQVTQIAISHQFKDQVNMVSIIEHSEYLGKMSMSQIHLNFDFPSHMSFQLLFLDFLLGQLLDHTDKSKMFLSGQENITISSFPNFIEQLEVINIRLLNKRLTHIRSPITTIINLHIKLVRLWLDSFLLPEHLALLLLSEIRCSS